MRRLIVVKSMIQLAVAALLMESGFLWIGTIASVSREAAIAKVGYAIPEGWDRVILNHGNLHHWPFPPSILVPSLVVFLGCFTILVLYSLGYLGRGKMATHR